MDLGVLLPPPVTNINCWLRVGSLVLIPEGWQNIRIDLPLSEKSYLACNEV